MAALETCKVCDKQCSNIIRHIRDVHGHNGSDPRSIADINTAEGGIINRWKGCEICQGMFKSQLGLNQHKRMKHPQAQQHIGGPANQEEGEEPEMNEENQNQLVGPGPNGGLMVEILAAAGL